MKSFSSSLRGLAISATLLASLWTAIALDNRMQPPLAQGSLVEIKNINALRTQFNQDTGKTRLILLLSPT